MKDRENRNNPKGYLLHHLFKLLFFIFLQRLVIIHRCDIKLMFGFRLRWFKWTSKDGNFSIF